MTRASLMLSLRPTAPLQIRVAGHARRPSPVRPQNASSNRWLPASGTYYLACHAAYLRNKRLHSSCCVAGLAEFAGQPGRRGARKARQISLAARLRSYGFAGVVAYGLLNTVYYVTAFLFFWTHVAKVPKGLGLVETARRFVGVMSLTWAGSQVTKVARIAAALALAPMLDSACDFAQQKLGLSSKRTALSLVVFSCIALASLCFGATMLVWA